MTAEFGDSGVRRDALRSEHADLVKAIAYQFFRRENHFDFVALIQVGTAGPGAAISGHEHDSAEVFEAHARTLIREAMLDVVRGSD